MKKQIATFEKKGKEIKVLVHIPNAHRLNIYLELNGVEVMVKKINKHHEHGFYYSLSGKSASKLFDENFKKESVAVLSETAEDVKEKSEQMFKEYHKNQVENDFSEIKEDTKIALAFGSSNMVLTGNEGNKHKYFNNLNTILETIEKDEIETLLNTEPEIDQGDYSLEYKYAITFSDYKNLVEIAEKRMNTKQAKQEEKALDNKKLLEEKFSQAKQTGEKVAIGKWSEPCNDNREECNLDMVTKYAMPDGSAKVVKTHTW